MPISKGLYRIRGTGFVLRINKTMLVIFLWNLDGIKWIVYRHESCNKPGVTSKESKSSYFLADPIKILN